MAMKEETKQKNIKNNRSQNFKTWSNQSIQGEDFIANDRTDA